MHYLCACLIFKDSARYLDEWIRFHLLVGFDHLYLYDNDSSDDGARIVRRYVRQKRVTLCRWSGTAPQMAVYQHCLNTHRQDSRWIAFIDDDEFLFPAQHESLKEVLPKYEEYPGVGACWLLFGSSGHRRAPAEFVARSYRRRASWVDKHVKCIVDPTRVSAPAIIGHAFHCTAGEIVDENRVPTDGPFSRAPSAEVLCLNHYLIKSEEEMLQRRSRPSADGNPRPHPISTWRLLDSSCNEVEDVRIQRFADKLQRRKVRHALGHLLSSRIRSAAVILRVCVQEKKSSSREQ